MLSSREIVDILLEFATADPQAVADTMTAFDDYARAFDPRDGTAAWHRKLAAAFERRGLAEKHSIVAVQSDKSSNGWYDSNTGFVYLNTRRLFVTPLLSAQRDAFENTLHHELVHRAQFTGRNAKSIIGSAKKAPYAEKHYELQARAAEHALAYKRLQKHDAQLGHTLAKQHISAASRTGKKFARQFVKHLGHYEQP